MSVVTLALVLFAASTATIFGASHFFQMAGVDASSGFAKVVKNHPFGDRAVRQVPSHSMGESFWRVVGLMASVTRDRVTSPQPARISLVDVGPESFLARWGGVIVRPRRCLAGSVHSAFTFSQVRVAAPWHITSSSRFGALISGPGSAQPRVVQAAKFLPVEGAITVFNRTTRLWNNRLHEEPSSQSEHYKLLYQEDTRK